MTNEGGCERFCGYGKKLSEEKLKKLEKLEKREFIISPKKEDFFFFSKILSILVSMKRL
jgi:hypothetical protein